MPAEGEDEDDDADEFVDDADGDEDEDEGEPIEVESAPRGESIIEVTSDPELAATPSKPSRGARQRPALLKTAEGLGSTVLATPSKFTKGTGTKLRQRSVVEWGTGGQEMRWKDLFGPSHDDIMPAFETRDQWSFQDTLPSRSQGSLRRSFFTAKGARDKELKTTREWYSNVGRAAFAAKQKTRVLDEEEGRPYLVNPGSESMNLLMGDLNEPRLYTLKQGEFISTSVPFKSSTNRRGWVLNLGSRIQEAQWAPIEEGQTQYLAVAVIQKDSPGHDRKQAETSKSRAFAATAPFKASLQIWAFDSVESGDIDPSSPPRLEQVICTDWGSPNSFKWWPIGAQETVDPTDNMVRLGLLGSIWSDGNLRILDVSIRKSASTSHRTRYVHYSRTAFEVTLPETIPTCVHWLSATSLTIATASGHMGIWTLTHPGTFPAPDADEVDNFTPHPWFYKQIADTYVLTLSSGYPSRPQYISITTADGFARLFDLRSPTSESCVSIRGRILLLTQAWHEQSLCFVTPDEHYMLKHNSIRRYYANVYAMRLESTVTCCAASPVQPCVLLGGSDGLVVAGNTMSKVLHQKVIPWQQPWFKHEWRPSVDKLVPKMRVGGEQANEMAAGDEHSGAGDTSFMQDDLLMDDAALFPSIPGLDTAPPNPPKNGSGAQTNVPENVLSQPLTRITEGYKASQVGLQHPDQKKGYQNSANIVTIHEEKSAISRLAWNPNLKFGTWAAAGTNSGILRVEDLGI